MKKLPKPINTWVQWTEAIDAGKRKPKNVFSRFTKFDDGTLLCEPITKAKYYKERG